jgi:hypothetical protein
VAGLLLAVAATLGVVLATPMPPLLRAALVLYVAANAARACRALLAPRGLRLDRSRVIEVLADAGWRSGEVRDGSFVMPWLTIIRWRPAGARLDRTLVLLPGMAGAGELRKIRVMLRWA